MGKRVFTVGVGLGGIEAHVCTCRMHHSHLVRRLLQLPDWHVLVPQGIATEYFERLVDPAWRADA